MEIAKQPNSSLPFGPYIAACFGAAEIFKQMRMRAENYVSTVGWFDAWSLSPSVEFHSDGPVEFTASENQCTLAGVGAVGTAFLHTMAACTGFTLEAVIADNDNKGIDRTNLNRYVLFGADAIGQLKPDAVCKVVNQKQLSLRPWNSAAENLPQIPGRLLSAVDKNRARQALQFRYPGRIISASTLDLRVEVHRCGPPGIGACLRCFNEPESLPSDDTLIDRLKRADDHSFRQICEEAQVDLEAAREWIRSKQCGDAGYRLLHLLRSADSGDELFAVGFTSVLAGVLLGGEFVKDCIGSDCPTNAVNNRAIFQFFDVMSAVNSASFFAKDVNCPCCRSDRPGLTIWRERFSAIRPNR